MTSNCMVHTYWHIYLISTITVACTIFIWCHLLVCKHHINLLSTVTVVCTILFWCQQYDAYYRNSWYQINMVHTYWQLTSNKYWSWLNCRPVKNLEASSWNLAHFFSCLRQLFQCCLSVFICIIVFWCKLLL